MSGKILDTMNFKVCVGNELMQYDVVKKVDWYERFELNKKGRSERECLLVKYLKVRWGIEHSTIPHTQPFFYSRSNSLTRVDSKPSTVMVIK